MSLEKITNEDYEMDTSANGAQTPGNWNDDFIAVTEVFSNNNKADGKKLLNGPVVIKNASNCSMSGYSFITGVEVGPANCTKCKSDGFNCFKEGTNVGTGFGIFIMNGSPPIPYVCSCTHDIGTGGSDNVDAE